MRIITGGNVSPITFESLTGNKCLVDTFDRNFQYSVEHVSLAKQAGAGFGTDTNIVTFLSKDDMVELPIMSKEEVADRLLDYILFHRKNRSIQTAL